MQLLVLCITCGWGICLEDLCLFPLLLRLLLDGQQLISTGVILDPLGNDRPDEGYAR